MYPNTVYIVHVRDLKDIKDSKKLTVRKTGIPLHTTVHVRLVQLPGRRTVLRTWETWISNNI